MLHDDRTFVRHFSWVIVGLVAVTIFFIFLAFLIVGLTGVDSHSGYSYVQYLNQHPAASAASTGAAQAASAQTGGAAVAAAAATGAMVATNSAINGQAIWQAHCSACHQTGIAGAPRIGDKAAWGPILKETDLATLYQHAIKGYSGKLGFMPPKGGATNLSDAEVEAAVRYMVDKSK
ncbi:MAG: c-type cytochrome [Gammaproteobacteria bacterium]